MNGLEQIRAFQAAHNGGLAVGLIDAVGELAGKVGERVTLVALVDLVGQLASLSDDGEVRAAVMEAIADNASMIVAAHKAIGKGCVVRLVTDDVGQPAGRA